MNIRFFAHMLWPSYPDLQAILKIYIPHFSLCLYFQSFVGYNWVLPATLQMQHPFRGKKDGDGLELFKMVNLFTLCIYIY
jgi:hypothetical protein